MRIDLPLCDFKNCRCFFDGNCNDKNKYSSCLYKNYKAAFEFFLKDNDFETQKYPSILGFYKILVLNKNNNNVDISFSRWNGKEFENIDEKNEQLLAWEKVDCETFEIGK